MEKANVLKDGDIIAYTTSSGLQWIGIFKQYGERGLADIHYYLDIHGNLCEGVENFHLGDYHLATEDEKEKLFTAIKDNGYKWNAETKTLEELNIVAGHIIAENREIVKEVLLTVPKEWEICGTDDGNETFAIVIQMYTPHRMNALTEALKRLGVIGHQKATTFVLSPEWGIDYTKCTREMLALQKYKFEFEFEYEYCEN